MRLITYIVAETCFVHTGEGFPKTTSAIANVISYTLIRPVGKVKIENFLVFGVHWLYRTSRYAIVKVDVTERYDVTNRLGIVITTWRTSAIEVTALSKPTFRNERYARKRIYHWCDS